LKQSEILMLAEDKSFCPDCLKRVVVFHIFGIELQGCGACKSFLEVIDSGESG